MECPACGRIIPDQSAFCLYCGEKIQSGEPAGESGQAWETQDVFLPNASFAKTQTLILRNREEPLPSDLQKLWDVYFPQVQPLLSDTTREGWEVDPAGLDPECILYEIRGQTFRDYTRADWAWTAVLTLLSAGIYLLFIQLANRSNQVVDPKGLNLRLRRMKDRVA